MISLSHYVNGHAYSTSLIRADLTNVAVIQILT